jgi:hypothetical protein
MHLQAVRAARADRTKVLKLSASVPGQKRQASDGARPFRFAAGNGLSPSRHVIDQTTRVGATGTAAFLAS